MATWPGPGTGCKATEIDMFVLWGFCPPSHQGLMAACCILCSALWEDRVRSMGKSTENVSSEWSHLALLACPGVLWSVWDIGLKAEKALARCWVVRGGYQPPSRYLVLVISPVYCHRLHQRPREEAFWKCGSRMFPPHAPGTWVGCSHHCSPKFPCPIIMFISAV